jgi:acyl carrier protein
VLHIEYAAAPLPFGLEWAEASGLDSVELLLAIEEEFGVDIPDERAEKITTVGEMYDYLQARVSATPAVDCLTQKIFYKLRRALLATYKVKRSEITPETRLDALLSRDELEQGWPYLQIFIDMKTPNFKESNEFLGFILTERTLKMRELVSALIKINSDQLLKERDSDAELWRRLVDVIVGQMNVSRDEVTYGASFNRDLGVC